MCFRKIPTFNLVFFGLLIATINSYGQSEKTLWDSIYSAQQAARGREVYDLSCVACHSADLRGNSNAPSLIGMSFMFLWKAGNTLCCKR